MSYETYLLAVLQEVTHGRDWSYVADTYCETAVELDDGLGRV